MEEDLCFRIGLKGKYGWKVHALHLRLEIWVKSGCLTGLGPEWDESGIQNDFIDWSPSKKDACNNISGPKLYKRVIKLG